MSTYGCENVSMEILLTLPNCHNKTPSRSGDTEILVQEGGVWVGGGSINGWGVKKK